MANLIENPLEYFKQEILNYFSENGNWLITFYFKIFYCILIFSNERAFLFLISHSHNMKFDFQKTEVSTMSLEVLRYQASKLVLITP